MPKGIFDPASTSVRLMIFHAAFKANWTHSKDAPRMREGTNPLCHDPSHGGFYMAEGASYIRIGLPPHVVSGDCLVSSLFMDLLIVT